MRRALAVVLGASLGLAGGGAAAEPVRRVATLATEGSPWGDAMVAFARDVSEGTKRRVKLGLLLGGVGGDEVDAAHLCAAGKVFMWIGSAGALAHVVPELNALELPFLFDDDPEVDAALSGPVFGILGRAIERRGLVLLPRISEVGWRSFAGPRPLRTPADFEGLRARSQENPVHLEMWRLLGASPRAISVLETYDALQAGVVQGFDQSPVYLLATSWHQQARVYTLSRHIYQPGVAVLCKGAAASLSAQDRRVLLEAGASRLGSAVASIRALQAGVIEQLRGQGVRIVELSAAERAALRDRTRPTFQVFRAGTSALGRELLDALERAIGARRRSRR